MKLSKEIKNYMVIILDGMNSLTAYGVLKSFLPQVELLEKDNEEIFNALIEMIKCNLMLSGNIAYTETKQSIDIIEKATGKKWEDIK